MTERFDRILASYGQDVTVLQKDGESRGRAFVQLLCKKQEKPPVKECTFGAQDLRRWNYIGPKDIALQEGDVVCTDEGRYVVLNAAQIRLGAECSH